MDILGDKIKGEFPIFQQYPDLIYVDNASTSQKPRSVIEAMSDYQIDSYANIHRGVYHLSELSELSYNSSKKKLAGLIGADFREIVYTYNATHAANILIQSLRKHYNLGLGDTILLGIRDHHATIVSWQLLAQEYGFDIQFIDIDKQTLDINRVGLGDLIDRYHPKIVCCSHVSNITGAVYDISRLKKLLTNDIFLMIDGSQAVPHMRVNVTELGCDAYLCTGHKMLGPTGVGILWIQKSYARVLQTTFGGGGIVESVTTQGCSLIRTADKFEAGTPNLIGAVGLGAACDFYTDNDIYSHIGVYDREMVGILIQGLMRHDYISVIGLGSPLPTCGIVSFGVPDPSDFAEYLAAHNICVRIGGHCAHPFLHYMGYGAGVVRISSFLYTTLQDIYRILEVIDGYRG